MMQPLMHPDPTKRLNSSDNFYVDSHFVKDGGRFKRALAGSNDSNALSQLRKLAALVTMRSAPRREIRKNFGSFSERPNARCNDDSPGADYRTIGKSDLKTRTIATNLGYTLLLQIAAQLRLKPFAVCNEG